MAIIPRFGRFRRRKSQICAPNVPAQLGLAQACRAKAAEGVNAGVSASGIGSRISRAKPRSASALSSAGCGARPLVNSA
jgi:hypothetical protein